MESRLGIVAQTRRSKQVISLYHDVADFDAFRKAIQYNGT